ncbi:Alpha/beta hydrolase family protein [Anaeromicropila populeti]|uniref:Alpha/beta hydrolase family protein n=1 Tax=Anaeromicropila populeti TaxID=37658 RepID=A0A1I6K7Y9_9FIRM|nr:Alpha/beta hydrolase family protein [Anaeromicropila populeti]
MAQRGYCVAAIDNRLHGDRGKQSFAELNILEIRKAIKETAEDISVLIDELSVQENTDKNRIAMIGISMGGFITFQSCILDKRIKVAIPIISSPYWDDIPGDVIILNDETLKEELILFSEKYQPANYLEKFYPTALFMQVGEEDKHSNVDKVLNFYYDLKKHYCDALD